MKTKLLSLSLKQFAVNGRAWRAAQLVVGVGWLCTLPATAAVLSWSGTGAPDGNWSNGANWGFAGTPANGDTLIFSGGQPNLINTNNIVGLTLNQIRFVGAGGGYDLRGNSFTLTNNLIATNTIGTNILRTPITLATTDQTVNVTDTLTLAGQLSGGVGVIKTGAGTLNYNAGSNPYTGTTTVNAGTLVLSCGGVNVAYGGPLIINNATVRLGLSYETPNSQPITINTGGVFDLNNLPEELNGSLTLNNGGSVNVGTASLTIIPPSTITVTGGGTINSSGAGNIQLGAGPCGINVVSGTFTVNPILAGSAAITKTGAGNLRFFGTNTYTGVTTIEAGLLEAFNNLALGATNGGTVVNGTAGLELNNSHITNEVLTLNSTLASGALQDQSTGDWVGPITLNTNVVIEASSAFGIDGVISGPGGFTMIGGNVLTLRGSTANTYAGTSTVNSGTLVLGKSSGVAAVPGNVVILSGGTMTLANNLQTVDSADILVNAGGWFELSTFYTYIDTLRGSGTVNFGVDGWISLSRNDGSSTFDGSFTGVGYASGWTVGMEGTGTFTMNGNNTFSAGNYSAFASGSKMVINGSHPRPTVRVSAGATLGGSGTVGNIESYSGMGSVSPGTSPGILTSSNVTFTSTGNFTAELNGPTPGTGHDQLVARGTVNLANAGLTLLPGFTTPVAVGQQFTIINNDAADAVVGTFSGLPQGATNSTSGYKFTVSYTGGTGNDVVLTLIDLPVGSVNSAATVSAGNGDGIIAPNECNGLSVVITNKTGSPLTGISATLASLTPGVVVPEASSPFPNAGSNGKSTNSIPFQIATTPSFVCGSTIDLQLIVTTASHGSFIIPVTLPTGAPAGTPVRFDNNIIVNVPDIGTIDSTNTVSAWSGGPITKVAVSLWLVAPFSADMNLSLIAPNGTTIDLSSGNGGAGANFGTGSADGSRTLFDDAAATAITAGASPFVGSFRPEVNLTTLTGTSPVVGDWRLRVNDAFGSGSPDTLRAWSLFLYGTDCGTGSGLCELCPNVTFTSAIGPSTPLQTNYLVSAGGGSSCGVPKVCPGQFTGVLPADNHAFRNGPSDACITVTLTNISVGGGMAIASYSAGYNPFDPVRCNNYLADPGVYVYPGVPATYSFYVASNTLFYVNTLGASYGTYQLTVTGGDCRPALNVTDVGAGKAKLDWTTAAAGFQLEGTNVLGSGAAWGGVTSSPVVINSRYTVTNTVPAPNQFYRLRKSVP